MYILLAPNPFQLYAVFTLSLDQTKEIFGGEKDDLL